MLIRSFVRSFVCRQRVLVGKWPDWPSRAIVWRPWAAAALLGHAAHRCPRCFLPRKKT